MSEGEWPEDPKDPRCPECDGPVSATASYCMHCEADLPAGDFGDLRSGSTDDATGTTDDVTAQVEAAAAAESSESASDRVTHGEDKGRARSGEGDALVDPDSLLDDVSTVMVGLVAGALSIVLGGLVLFWFLPQGWGNAAFWLSIAGGIAVGVWTARTRTVFGAARKAGLTLGGLLALVPFSLGVALDWQSTGDAIGGVFVFGIFLWPIALIVGGVGWIVGYGGVDEF